MTKKFWEEWKLRIGETKEIVINHPYERHFRVRSYPKSKFNYIKIDGDTVQFEFQERYDTTTKQKFKLNRNQIILVKFN